MFSIDLRGKCALVTGASRGLGRSIATSLAEAGCDIGITFRENEVQAIETAKAIPGGRKVFTVAVDLQKQDSCEEAVERLLEKFGRIDILVNNAGIVDDNLFLTLDDESWEKVIGTNLFGTVRMTRLLARQMMMNRWGRIINISSVAASKGGRGQTNYAASKGAIEAMTRSLAVELASRNITVNCLAPGVIETDMSAEVRRLAESEILQRQLIKRFSQPTEIAAWVVFMASEFGSFMTGEVIHVDGGMKMP